eukprot:8538493-Pyramimonas_sp.AAC.1
MRVAPEGLWHPSAIVDTIPSEIVDLLCLPARVASALPDAERFHQQRGGQIEVLDLSHGPRPPSGH